MSFKDKISWVTFKEMQNNLTLCMWSSPSDEEVTNIVSINLAEKHYNQLITFIYLTSTLTACKIR